MNSMARSTCGARSTYGGHQATPGKVSALVLVSNGTLEPLVESARATCNVTAVRSEAEALAVARRDRPQVVVATEVNLLVQLHELDPTSRRILVIDRDVTEEEVEAAGLFHVFHGVPRPDAFRLVLRNAVRMGVQDVGVPQAHGVRRPEAPRNHLLELMMHDLRSPLAVAQLCMQQLEDLDFEGSVDEERQEIMTDLAGGISRLGRLVDSFLDVRRLEADQVSLTRAPWDLLAMAREAADDLHQVAALGEVTVEVNGGPEPIAADCDRGLVRRVLVNLIDHGLHHAPGGTTLRIDVDRSVDGASVRVSDRGPSLAPTDRGRIFDRSLASRERGKRSGAGLGLAFCRLAVEAHGGSIHIDHVAEGAALRVVLPRAHA